MPTQTCKCGYVLKIKEEQIGKRGRCPRCAEIVRLGTQEEEAPSKKKRRKEQEEEEERREAEAEKAETEEEDESEDEAKEKRRKRKKKKKKAGFFSFMPSIAVEFGFLGVSGTTWILTILLLIVLGMTAYFFVPGWGPRTYYSIEPFGEAPPEEFAGTTTKGIVVSVHNTAIGRIDAKLVTVRWRGGLKGMVRSDREATIHHREAVTRGGTPVNWEVKWSADKGVISVTVEGNSVPCAIWEFDSGQER